MTEQGTFSRRALITLLLVFVVTRGLGVWVSVRPEGYGRDIKVTRDYELYEQWATRIVDGSAPPYKTVDLEYPPGSLLQLLPPGIADRDLADYRAVFVVLAVLLDVLALAFLYWLAVRWGSLAGPWAWTVGLALLGPLPYARLDLLPALATIVAAERAAVGSWGFSGGWLGFAAATKLYPALLMPGAAAASRDQTKWLTGAAAGIALPLLPFVLMLPDVLSDVFGYHGERGIQIESLWGSGLFVAIRNGYNLEIDADFGAYHFNTALVPLMKLAASAITVGAVLAAPLVLRRTKQPQAIALSQVAFPVLALAVAFGTVLSPQYLIWLLALGAVALCTPDSPLRPPIYLMCAAAFLTHLLFPFFYNRLQAFEAVPVFLLVVRNLLLVLVALWATVATRRWLRA
ncbi:MAG TPA: glycosyltransferase family 87 protein [Actinomycetota bacterium]|nr:glycosyltransferase family 87 protein [Actinomycetota bacterium]